MDTNIIEIIKQIAKLEIKVEALESRIKELENTPQNVPQKVTFNETELKQEKDDRKKEKEISGLGLPTDIMNEWMYGEEEKVGK